MAIAKEQLRHIIAQNDINSVGDIYTLCKDSFKDMLQELLEAEMDIPRDRKGTFEPKIIPKYQMVLIKSEAVDKTAEIQELHALTSIIINDIILNNKYGEFV